MLKKSSRLWYYTILVLHYLLDQSYTTSTTLLYFDHIPPLTREFTIYKYIYYITTIFVIFVYSL